ncbi:helix-turn-helix domain-containing protein [Flavobacterium oreochromis]|uniref:AraC family transcriptional regulator n=1 Tax=Flavobacterium oreochromis TaxID=2906078 RepID=UPI001CE5B172|nr:AraC family transcriptional regulator [Flavobacterium oreochromis]QYS86459.1 helix-turn-helix domain-containing protein [Flavobacterium oreochromis]
MNNEDNQNIINEYHLNRHQPNKPQFATYDLHEYINKHKEHTTKPHIHSYYQIIWFQEGQGEHFVDFKSHKVVNDTVFFIAKNQVHYFDDNVDYKGILLHFNEDFLVQKESETDFFLKYNLFNNPYQNPYCTISDQTNVLLSDYIQLIQKEAADQEDFGKEEILRAYLKSFLIQIQRKKNICEKTRKETPFILDDKRVQFIKFINLVDQNYTKGLSVSEYASLLMISSRTLSDLTQQLINKTPLQIIQERIILESQRLLLHSELNVTQIGYRLGFEDPSYFVKFFKKHANMSPSEFRKSITTS